MSLSIHIDLVWRRWKNALPHGGIRKTWRAGTKLRKQLHTCSDLVPTYIQTGYSWTITSNLHPEENDFQVGHTTNLEFGWMKASVWPVYEYYGCLQLVNGYG